MSANQKLTLGAQWSLFIECDSSQLWEQFYKVFAFFPRKLFAEAEEEQKKVHA